MAVREEMLPAARGLNRILMLVRSGTGHDFSQYKKMAIGRCIEWRMSHHEIEDAEVYARYVEENPDEGQLLVKELLINVTRFFRNPEAFETLKKDVLPQLFAGKPKGSVFRAWVAGCATGEESYSIAMLLREFMDETRQEIKVQIYSTDLDDDAISVARAGTYPNYIAQDVESERLHRFFVKVDAGYQVNQEIRKMVVFANQNVIKDPPFTGLDLVSCRNLMIYLEPELQSRLITTFQFALRPGGALFLSPSESIVDSELFAPLSREWRIYRTHRVAAPDEKNRT
jgi:two-component system CheB/CheR fusion protein